MPSVVKKILTTIWDSCSWTFGGQGTIGFIGFRGPECPPKYTRKRESGQRPHAGSLFGSSALSSQPPSFIKENAGHLPYAGPYKEKDKNTVPLCSALSSVYLSVVWGSTCMDPRKLVECRRFILEPSPVLLASSASTNYLHIGPSGSLETLPPDQVPLPSLHTPHPQHNHIFITGIPKERNLRRTLKYPAPNT